MKKWLIAVLFGSALVLGACGGDDTNDEPANDDTAQEDPADNGGADNGADDGADNNADNGTDEGDTVDTAAAEEAFQANCAGCHGADLTSGYAADLNKIGSELSAEEIADVIKNGKGGMPAQGQVSDSDREAIANWLAEKK